MSYEIGMWCMATLSLVTSVCLLNATCDIKEARRERVMYWRAVVANRNIKDEGEGV